MIAIRFLAILAVVLLLAVPCAAESDGDCVYSLYSAEGELLTMRAGRMYEGDEYISGDNRHFKITRVDDSTCSAWADYIGMSEAAGSSEAEELLASLGAAHAEGNKGLICMYSTHSDESYVPDDGESSKWKNAGIYDVGDEFKKQLEELGYEVVYSDDTFLPHDAGAYSRSASTAEELLKKSPDALFDIHRDGVPADQYETEVDGEELSMVRLFVGRSNANKDANMAFAKRLKAVADEEYPGLVKDIYMGKGNYNQELYPQALLLEFGTHEIDKDLVLKSTGYMAEVVDTVISGDSNTAEKAPEGGSGAGKALIWVIVIAVVAALLYGLASTGKLGGAWDKLKRSISEITGGSAGKRK